jgi:hypothetical protein
VSVVPLAAPLVLVVPRQEVIRAVCFPTVGMTAQAGGSREFAIVDHAAMVALILSLLG